MKKSKDKGIVRKVVYTSGILSLLVIGGIVGSLMLFQTQDVIVEQFGGHPSRSWGAFGDSDPGGDNSGFMYFMVYPHQGSPGTAYASNLSNASAYEYSDSLNAEMTGETPYDTTFDFVMKFRVNDTIGYNTSSGTWEASWVRANITCDFDFASDIPSDTAMTIVEIGHNSDFCWYNAYINNGGSGYTITHNEKFNVTSVTMDGYW